MEFIAPDDFIHTGSRLFILTATSTHSRVDSDTHDFTVEDDDRTITGWRVTPSTIFENGGVTTLTAFKYRLHERGVVKMSLSAAPADRVTLSGDTLTFEPGALYATESPTITAVDNGLTDGDQTVTITAAVTEGRGIRTPPPLELTVMDDEGVSPAVALRLNPARVTEGLASTVTAEATHPLPSAATITVSAAPGHAQTLASDFVLSSNTVLEIPAGGTKSMGSVTITAVDDAVRTGRRRLVTVSGTITGGGGVAAPGDEVMAVLEDDSSIRIELALTPATISEGAMSTVTLRAAAPVPSDATLTISLGGSADAVELSTNAVLTIAEGQTMSAGVVTVTALDDADDQNEVVSVVARPSVDSAFLAANSSSLYVLDNDSTATWLNVSPVPQRMYEGDSQHGPRRVEPGAHRGGDGRDRR